MSTDTNSYEHVVGGPDTLSGICLGLASAGLRSMIEGLGGNCTGIVIEYQGATYLLTDNGYPGQWFLGLDSMETEEDDCECLMYPDDIGTLLAWVVEKLPKISESFA